MRRLVLLMFALLPSIGLAQARFDIPLQHLTLHWTADEGLSVTCDGRPLFLPTRNPVVAYPSGWAWSYSAANREHTTATLRQEGNRRILTIKCTDPKLNWQQTIVAGPGDTFHITYQMTQRAWDEAMNYEVGAAPLAVNWFVGSTYTIGEGAAAKAGAIPSDFGGVTNPFVAGSGAFSGLFGKLYFRADAPLTLYDYKQRDKLWLGRDGALPKGREQKYAVLFTFQPRPLVVDGVEISGLAFQDQLLGQRFALGLALRRVGTGPQEVQVKLASRGNEAITPAITTVALTEAAQPVKLSLPLGQPGTYRVGFELIAEGKSFYQSPPLMITVPRLLTIMPARVPFATGDQGLLLAEVAPQAGQGLTVTVNSDGTQLYSGMVSTGRRVEIPISLTKFGEGRKQVVAELQRGQELLGTAQCDLFIASPHANGVIIDHRSHTLLLDGLPFSPHGCYADLRSVAGMIETEAPLGVNVVAPYLFGDINERRQGRDDFRKLLDRCAQIGIHVQLDLRNASHQPQDEEKWAWVKEEITAFRDHSALLSYYLADEPELGWASPEECRAAYDRIKELDPWHPVTMVFCQSSAAARYAGSYDIVMTDPYPIPNGPVTNVVDFCERINRDLGNAVPLWIVPQAFGGGEWWSREPSRQEERVMTYLALIHGARGVQYFIRRPPVINPNSPDLWSECRRLMLEVSQLTPALASAEAQPKVTTDLPQVHVAAFRERGAITILAANIAKQPTTVTFTLPVSASGKAEVVFENRSVEVKQGKLTDMIDGMGTRVYRLQVTPPPTDLGKLDPKNLTSNPSWEEMVNVGTPDGCYVGFADDKAASWFVDPRVAAHGRQSLRLRAPNDGQGMNIMPYPMQLTPGKKYVLSVWAKGEREGQRFRLSFDTVKGDQAQHTLTTQWQQYTVEFTASDAANRRISPSFTLLSAGCAWFDVLQVIPVD